MKPDAPSTSGRRIGLTGCALAAMASLPHGVIPSPWLAAFAGPAIVAGRVKRLQGPGLEPFAIFAAVQAATLFAAYTAAGPLPRPWSIGASLIPLLAFSVARAESLDVLRGVFLALCLLLVGTSLGGISPWAILVFVVCSAWTLLHDVHVGAAEDRASARAPQPTRGRALASTVPLVLGCVSTFVVVLSVLRSVPGGDESRSSATAPGETAAVGPGSDFDFGNPAGSLLTLRSDRIVRVRNIGPGPVEDGLYLRCAAFDVAGLDRWGTRPARFRTLPGGGRPVPVGFDRPGRDAQTIEIEILQTDPGLVYVPAGTFELSAPAPVAADLTGGVFRFPNTQPPAAPWSYAAAYRSTAFESLANELPDERLVGMTELLDDLRPHVGMFERLMATPRARRAVDPVALAEAIAASLHERCAYALREPTGPHAHSVLNFLEGSREGYCMHFASVTAICLRLAGVPARIGAGLYGGDPDEESPGAQLFGSQHAHAWVEVPYPGRGWVVFDPTPPAALENLRWIDFSSEGDAAAAETQGVGEPIRWSDFRLPDLGPFALLLLALPFVPWILGGRRRTRGSQTQRVAAGAETARAFLDALLRELAKCGHPRFGQEPLEAYADRLGKRGLDPAPIAGAFRAYHEVRFGGLPFDESRRMALRDARPHDD
ncbi:MAG: transglutaminase TgpA family protein [Planctomycetota bacterium]